MNNMKSPVIGVGVPIKGGDTRLGGRLVLSYFPDGEAMQANEPVGSATAIMNDSDWRNEDFAKATGQSLAGTLFSQISFDEERRRRFGARLRVGSEEAVPPGVVVTE